jgi:O-antigen/teichoic acid export membrane protein
LTDVPPEGPRSAKVALVWGSAGGAGRAALGLLLGVVYARLLGPEAIGTAALAILVFGAAQVFMDLGLPSAIIQSKELSQRDVSSVNATGALVGVVLATACVLGAPAAAGALGAPEAKSSLQLIAVAIAAQAVGQVPSALLRRDLRYKELQAAQFFGYVFGYAVVGIVAAFFGAGALAVVLAQVVATFYATASVVHFARAPFRPLAAVPRRLVTFGLTAATANVATWALLNTAAAGRLFGAEGVGLYTRVFLLLFAPVQALAVPLQAVLFAKQSQSQTAEDGPASADVCNALVLLLGPPLVTLVMIPDLVVLALYGPEWTAASALVAPIAVNVASFALTAPFTARLWAGGHPASDLLVTGFAVAIFLSAVAVAPPANVASLAWYAATATAVRFALSVLLTDLKRTVRSGDLPMSLLRPLPLLATVAFVTEAIESALDAAGTAPILIVTTCGVCTATLTLTGLVVGRPVLANSGVRDRLEAVRLIRSPRGHK